jgi:hypothetical protein
VHAPTGRIDIGHRQTQPLAQAQTQAVEGEEEHAIAEDLRRLKQTLGLRDRDDVRQALRPRWLDQIDRHPRPVEHVGVVELQPVEIELHRAPGVRGQQIGKLETRGALRAWCAGRSVLYAQEYLSMSEDLRVVWLGNRVLTAYWRRGGDGFRRNVARGATLDDVGIPSEALELVATLAGALGIDHAGFDIAWVDGHPYLLELNVLFGNAGIREAGIDMAGVILAYLREKE